MINPIIYTVCQKEDLLYFISPETEAINSISDIKIQIGVIFLKKVLARTTQQAFNFLFGIELIYESIEGGSVIYLYSNNAEYNKKWIESINVFSKYFIYLIIKCSFRDLSETYNVGQEIGKGKFSNVFRCV